MTKSQKRLSPIHPGEILRAEFMQPLGLSMNRLALDLRVPVTRIAEIVQERRAITPAGVPASMIKLKLAANGGVTRSSLGTNSTITARPPGFNDACTLRSNASQVS